VIRTVERNACAACAHRPLRCAESQEVVADMLDALPTGAAVGKLAGLTPPVVGPPSSTLGQPAGLVGVGSKRKREEGTLQLDDGAVEAALGVEALGHTPRRLRVALNAANTTRALLHSPGVSATFLGKAVGTGAVTIDPADPLWAAHRSQLRAKDNKAQASKKTTKLESDAAAMAVAGRSGLASAAGGGGRRNELASILGLVHDDADGDGGGGGGASSGWRMRHVLGTIGRGGFSVSTSGSTGAVGSISELFEQTAYWSFADLVKKLGAKEVSLCNTFHRHRAHLVRCL